MCWSWPVSLFFASIETVCCVFVIYACYTYEERYKGRNGGKRPPFSLMKQRDRLVYSIPFMLSINIVEWTEFFVWLSEPQPESVLVDQLEACMNCNRANAFFTGIAGLVTGLQPFITVFFAYKTHSSSLLYTIAEENDKNSPGNTSLFSGSIDQFTDEEKEQKYEELFNKSRDRFYIPYIFGVMSAIILIVFGVWLWLFTNANEGCAYNPDMPASMLAKCTCSYVGKNGHLVWNFAFPCRYQEFLPNIYNYLLLANIGQFFYAPCWMATPMLGSFYLFLANLIYFNGSSEVYSVWCWTGAGAVYVYVMVALVMNVDHSHEMFEKGGLNGDTVQVLKLLVNGTYQALKKSKPVNDFLNNTKRSVRKFLYLR